MPAVEVVAVAEEEAVAEVEENLLFAATMFTVGAMADPPIAELPVVVNSKVIRMQPPNRTRWEAALLTAQLEMSLQPLDGLLLLSYDEEEPKHK